MNETLLSQQLALTAQISADLHHSAVAYKEYLEGGKTFAFAQVLRLYNDRLLDLLLQKGHLLEGSLQKDAHALIAHYNAWTAKWEALRKHLDPAPGDEFIFQNEITFPRQAAVNLEQEYQRLQKLEVT